MAEPIEPGSENIEISPDFQVGNTREGLEKIRARLLDLTNRNRLLNYLHRITSSLRFVGVPLNELFQSLLDGQEVAIEPVPEPEEKSLVRLSEGGKPQKPDPKNYADSLGWNTSYDLALGGRWSGRLAVLQYLERLDTTTRRIESAARTAIEESGTNMLYLVFGFLEWYESDDSEQPHHAPLLIVPVSLERSRTGAVGFKVTLEYSGEDISPNLSLIEKLRKDFGLEMPSWNEGELPSSPEAYFSSFEDLLKLKRRWKIRPQLTLTLLSFGKFLMYRDLDAKNWPSEELLSHTLVRHLFEGNKSTHVGSPAEEYPIDAPDNQNRIVPSLVLDADSSQHSALIDALRGKNLVIEGPPGTGKSQTITNLIAAALAEGKTVLFVAEKLAALEVVRRRLDSVGLGMFCFELHSHKTKKQELIRDLDLRLKRHGSFANPGNLDAKRRLLDEKKALLNEYVSRVNNQVLPIERTVFDILWAREACLMEIESQSGLLGRILLSRVPEYSQEELDRTERFIEIYASHLRALLSTCGDLRQHPWAWVSNESITFTEQSQLLDCLHSLKGLAVKGQEILRRLSVECHFDFETSLNSLTEAAKLQQSLTSDEEPLINHLLEPFRSPHVRQAVREVIGSFDQIQIELERIRGYLVGDLGWNSAIKKRLAEAVAELVKAGLSGCRLDQIQALLDDLLELAHHMRSALQLHAELGKVLGVEASPSISGLQSMTKCAVLLQKAPLEKLHLRSAGMMSEGVTITISAARDTANTLESCRSDLIQFLDVDSTDEPSVLLNHAEAIGLTGFWGRMFSSRYKRARALHRSLSKRKRKRLEMAADLRELARFHQKRLSFLQRADLQTVVGQHFRGVESDWSGLEQVANWCEEVCVALPSLVQDGDRLRALLLEARREYLKSIHSELESVQCVSFEHVEEVKDILGRVDLLIERRSFPDLSDLAMQAETVASSLAVHLGTLKEAGIRDSVTVSAMRDLIAASNRVDQLLLDIESKEIATNALGDLYCGLQTNPYPIKRTLRFAEGVSSGSFPMSTVEWILCADYSHRLKTLRSQLRASGDTACDVLTELNHLDQICGSEVRDILSRMSLQELWDHAEGLVRRHEELPQWVQYLRYVGQSQSAGLPQLTNLADNGILQPDELLPSFRFVFFNSLSRSVFEEQRELSHFAGVTQDELRSQFASLDREVIKLNSEHFASRIDQRPVPRGQSAGPVGSWSELALVRHEISKQRRHIPIRQLMTRAGAALQALKPCFMMGPLSVAQYLAPGKLKFDLVVMDEASQLKPEDAIGAVARGGQLVVVGDPKQLPPTSFFQRIAIDDEEEDLDSRAVVQEHESILDVAMALYQPVRRLRWHYRSRHHSLIAFSNRAFYQDDLIIFPSAYEKKDDLGIRYHQVPGGIFENGRNPREADAVVNAVLDHLMNSPAESLGIVTLNFEQRELIEELLDQRLRKEPFAANLTERMNSGPEPVFIKNLENVQGDERDVIFISYTYGPDSKGNLYQRFGPINSENGHRRLNVLFTRAKKRVEVFSSLDPDKIRAEQRTARGVRVYRDYLQFARSGVLNTPQEGGNTAANDFERSVASILQDRGYEAIHQVGVAGFFIDLGVRHPFKPGAFLLGIECDGATYHSGRSARDRDRLRQEILENLGWKIHRIWSTDWFRSREKEVKRLIGTIAEILGTDPDALRERTRINRASVLIERLVEFRENSLKPAFPESSPQECLLNDALIEQFVKWKPKTRDEWFRKIPVELRTAIETKQVGRFLIDILRIVEEVESFEG